MPGYGSSRMSSNIWSSEIAIKYQQLEHSDDTKCRKKRKAWEMTWVPGMRREGESGSSGLRALGLLCFTATAARGRRRPGGAPPATTSSMSSIAGDGEQRNPTLRVPTFPRAFIMPLYMWAGSNSTTGSLNMINNFCFSSHKT